MTSASKLDNFMTDKDILEEKQNRLYMEIRVAKNSTSFKRCDVIDVFWLQRDHKKLAVAR